MIAPNRGQTGLALVTVVVVLVGLLIIATPFALSMRNLESTALLSHDNEAARAGALAALDAARQHLEDTHPFFDLDSPRRDDLAELVVPESSSGALVRDPTASVRAVRVEDEQGKVHLGTASFYLLGNLLGGRTVLTADVEAQGDTLAVASSEGFGLAGHAWLGLELVEYSAASATSLEECRRGFPSANLVRSRALSHRAGKEVLDGRLLLLAQHGWRIRPGIFDGFRHVEGLKDIGLYGELTYTETELRKVRPYLTVHGRAPRWIHPQRVQAVEASREGGAVLIVPDASAYGPGTVVQLQNAAGERDWNLVLSAIDWGPNWRVALLQWPENRQGERDSVVRALERAPVNVNTCDLRVLTALLEGLGNAPVADVINQDEAASLAQALQAAGEARDSDAALAAALRDPVLAGAFSLVDLTTAAMELRRQGVRPERLGPEELADTLVGLEARRPVRRVGPETAKHVARRIRAAAPGSHEELRDVLDTAVAAGECTAEQRDVILRCALDPGDASISGGTAPFTYSSDGLFTVRAVCSENARNGRERARAFVRELLSVAPAGETARAWHTQADFEEARAAGDGWTTHPRLMESGQGEAVMPSVWEAGRLLGAEGMQEAEVIGLVARFSEALGLGRRGASRIGTLIAGRPGPANQAPGSFAAPAPVRGGLEDTIHFDEGTAGLTGSGPRGFSFADGTVILPLEGLRPQLLSARGLLKTFSIAFWFELEDVEAETILFDGGTDELEDRVVLMLSGGELLFRVCDTGIPDFEADMPDGRGPPAGEIRYAFDDGLALLPGVPYHVLAWVGGASGSNMALFVDGVPRGRRSFTTFLTEDLDGGRSAGAGVASYAGSVRMRVDDTSGFPRQGVLSVGNEIVEYVDKEERAFLVRSAGESDPFGGRGKRNSAAREHPASQSVELMGYSLPLSSAVAARGAAALSSRLDQFALAELDPDRLSGEIEVSIVTQTGEQVQVTVGTGLLAVDVALPLRASGSLPLTAGMFQASGGHAILFCDYGGGAVVGTSFSDPGTPGDAWQFPARTMGGYFGGAEVIRYTGYSGGMLTGVARASAGVPQSSGPRPSSLAAGAGRSFVPGGSGSWQVEREFVTTFDPAILGANSQLPEHPRVLVIPISVGLTSGDLWNGFHPGGSERFGDRPGLVQLGLDFGSGDGATEWIRWDTAAGSLLVRDDLQVIGSALDLLAQEGSWNPDLSAVDEELARRINTRLRFRGQDFTRDGAHDGGEDVLPVHVLGGWGGSTDRPGRHDAVTLVAPGRDKEWQRVNHAGLNDPDWSGFALVAFRDPVVGEFVGTDPQSGQFSDFDPAVLDQQVSPDSDARRAAEWLLQDSRLITRLIKSPSGELPSRAPQVFRLGADYTGRAWSGRAVVDELRFSVPSTPGPLLPGNARYVLAEDLEFEEEDVAVLATSTLRYPHLEVRNPLLGGEGYEILSQLPQAGGLLLVGEEIVGYAGMDPVDTGSIFLTARGLYGTPAAFHRRGAGVIPLLFWPSSPLAADVSATSDILPVADGAAFPDGDGLVWVDDELVGYTGASADGLVLPARPGWHRFSREGLLRGRFGTVPAGHGAGAMVRWMPRRYADRALLGHDVPESEYLVLPIRAPGAFFTDLVVHAFLPDPSVGFELRAVLDGRASPHDDPAGTARVAAFEGSGLGEVRTDWPLARQADRLDLHLFARWSSEAFDPVRFTAQGWKQAPQIRSVVVGHIQPTLVLEHEEWR